MSTTSQTFGRLNVSDPPTQAAIQDIYNKLSQLQALVIQLQKQIAALTP